MQVKDLKIGKLYRVKKTMWQTMSPKTLMPQTGVGLSDELIPKDTMLLLVDVTIDPDTGAHVLLCFVLPSGEIHGQIFAPGNLSKFLELCG